MLKRRLVPERLVDDGAVVVCGAGAAGLAAALCSARQGASVLLVEAGPHLGGTVTNALIHTLAGLYDSTGRVINDGLPRELTERLLQADPHARQRKMGRAWVLNVCPNSYRDVVERWIARERTIRIVYRAQPTRAVQANRRIVELEVAASGRTFRVLPHAVIDATGTAEVARLLDPSNVVDEIGRAAGGWIFRLRGVAAGALDFPKGVAVVRELRAAAKTTALPAGCSQAWIDAGVYPDEAFVKLFVPLEDYWPDVKSLGEITNRLKFTQHSVLRFLRKLPGFEKTYITQTGHLGVRDGGRIRGRYTLTGDDVRQARSFVDAICRCSWPIEYWDPQRGVSVEYLPEGSCYEIPMRSLQLVELQNFWAVGKCLSADRFAQASARVVGTCWAMGQAAGASAHHLEKKYSDKEPVRTV
ncbi:MAG: FAD-dependent oxidoreductase [Planctomycetia bacterium]|nr:FAD-dependent oxidoreductase [Planctomycetia bacterium]